VNRRINSVALVRHRAAVRSIKFNLVVKDRGLHRNWNDDFQISNVFAWVPMDPGDIQSEVRALMAFHRKKQLTFGEFCQMVGRFCPQLNHVQITPLYVNSNDYNVAFAPTDPLIRWEQQVCRSEHKKRHKCISPKTEESRILYEYFFNISCQIHSY